MGQAFAGGERLCGDGKGDVGVSKFIPLSKLIGRTNKTTIVYVAVSAIRSIEVSWTDGKSQSMDSLLTFADGSVMRVLESPEAIIDEIKETCERTESKC